MTTLYDVLVLPDGAAVWELWRYNLELGEAQAEAREAHGLGYGVRVVSSEQTSGR